MTRRRKDDATSNSPLSATLAGYADESIGRIASFRELFPWGSGLICGTLTAGLGALARLALFGLASNNALYNTFWPGVFVAALIGGLPAGISATVVSACMVHLWLSPVKDGTYALGMAVFVAGATMVAAATDLLIRSRARGMASAETRAVKERLACIVESSNDAIVSHDMDGVVETWNESAERIFGYAASEAVGKPISTVMTASAAREELDAEERLKRGERIEDFETAMTRKDGKVIVVSMTMSPLKDAEGVVVGAARVVRDVTRRKRHETALVQSRIRLRHAADAARLTYFEYRISSAKIKVADNYGHVMGYEPKPSATGIAAAEAWPALIARVAPEDRDKAQGMIEKIGGGGPDGEIECRVVGDDGVERVIEARWKQEASGKDDKKKSVFATFSDVTERVKAREALSAAKAKADDVLASIGDGFCAIDARGVFTYFNAVAERMLARNGADMIGQHYLDLVPEYRGTVADRMIRTALAERLPMDFEDVSPARKTWTFYSLHPTGDGGLSILFRDISKQKATQDELVSSKHELERANKAKSRFIASASHDLRQPVQSLLLLLTMVERQVAEMPKTLSMVKLMQLALGGLNGLLTSILDISRLDAGVVEAANENVDLGALLGRLSSEYATKAAAHGLELRYVPRSVVVAADPTLLERALRNLVENALRYTPKGKVLIGVRRRGGQARIDVVDTGVGIPPERRSDIFEEFVQIDNPGRDPGKGMGLGLAVVERLATLVGARVEVDSNFGRGSRFSLSLPVVESVRKPPQALPAAVGNPGERILVVEDNFILRLTFEDMLRDWGYETISSGTGEAALEQAEHEGWNLSAIVTDHRLGAGMTGVQTAQEIRRRSGKAIPTLVVTGDTAKERIAEINASGFDLLHKPIGADELRRHVAAMVESGCGSDGKSFRLAAIGRMMTPKPKPEAMAAGK